MERLIQGRAIIPGEAAGELLLSSEPLSFWGGYDPATGEIIDRRHPLAGRIAAGKVLALPNTVGSSTTTAVLLEAVRARTAPAAILTSSTDSFLALASVVAKEMYGRSIPLVALSAADFALLKSGMNICVRADGALAVDAKLESIEHFCRFLRLNGTGEAPK